MYLLQQARALNAPGYTAPTTAHVISTPTADDVYQAKPTDAYILIDLSARQVNRDGPMIFLTTPVEDFPILIRNTEGDATQHNFSVWAPPGTTIEDYENGSFGSNANIYAKPLDGGVWFFDRAKQRFVNISHF